jgi:hypothetical protein
MISVTATIIAVLVIITGGAATLAWALCEMSSRQEREAERQQWLAWCARQDQAAQPITDIVVTFDYADGRRYTIPAEQDVERGV